MATTEPMLVKDLMSAHVITLDADDNLDLADMLMRTARVRHLPVVKSGRLVGLVTHRDLLRASVSSVVRVSAQDEAAFRQRITTSQIMIEDVETITSQHTALEAAQIMLREQIGCLVVVNAERAVVGIITESDYLQLAVKALSAEHTS